MTITNVEKIPGVFVNAVKRHEHKSGDYSASQFCKPGRMIMLEKRYADKITVDVLDRLWALFGTAVHTVLEAGEEKQALVESYFEIPYKGLVISGIADHYKNKTISDYKITSVWSYVFLADKLKEFESQLNINAFLFEQHSFPVERLKIVMIFRDFMKSKAGVDGYPEKQVVEIPINLWDRERQEQYIKDRVDYYESLKEIPDNELPKCTIEERWGKPPKYALVKTGRKSALKLFDSHSEAVSYQVANGYTQGCYSIEARPGKEFVRCEYCQIAEFCNQYQNRFEGV